MNNQGNLQEAKYIIIGSIIHSIEFGEIEIINNGGIVYNNNGIIRNVINLDINPINDYNQFSNVIDHTGKLIIPGFVDAHCHAPQYKFTGTGMDLPLLAWLEKYTFPCESKFSDEEFAKLVYTKSIQRHLSNGTTFASYFGTIHNNASKILVDIITSLGQRAFVGKVNMDRNSPDFYIENTIEGCNETEEFVQYTLSKSDIGRCFLQKLQDNNIIKVIDQLSNCYNSIINNEQVIKRPRSVSYYDNTSSIPTIATVSMKDNANNSNDNSSCNSNFPFQETRKPRSVTLSSMNSFQDLTTINSNSTTSNDNVAIAGKRKLHRVSTNDIVNLNHNNTIINNNITSLLNTEYTPLVMPCITPRFVPTCTSEMMSKLGSIATAYGLPIQSHLSESVNEIKWVSELHPECRDYTDVYNTYNLLNNYSYMAHCCHCNDNELMVLADTNTGVVHCASSNFMLNSGAMDVKRYVTKGIKVGLGTDVAGGYSPSMLDAIRQTLVASKCKLFESRITNNISNNEADNNSTDTASDITDTSNTNSNNAEYTPLTYKEAFHLATIGGAEVLNMDNIIGNFLPGKKLDCLVINVKSENSPIDVFEDETAIDYFQKFLFLGDDRNVENVYVDGKLVL